jgi:dipeptidyl aminopeptidase/acylaminoacyl peptidase
MPRPQPLAHCTRVAASLALLALLCEACFIPYGGELSDPHWSADGKEIFYLEQRFLSGPHPYEYFRLRRARPDLRGRSTQLASGSLWAGEVQPSANGRYLLFEDHPTLIVYDLERKRRAWSQTFERIGGLGVWGWADDRTVFLTDETGIRLISLPDGASRLVVAGRYLGLAGSRDGRWFLFATGRGWGDGDELTLFDRASGARRVLASVTSGTFGSARFLAADRRIAYVVQRIEGERSALVVSELATGESRRIWEGDVRSVSRLEPNRDENVFLLSGELGLGSSLYCIGSDGSERRIQSPRWNMRWDYDPASDRIISDDAGGDRFAVRSLAELGCTH